MTLTEFLEMNMKDETTIVCDYGDSDLFYEYLYKDEHSAVTDFINNEDVLFSLGAEQAYKIDEFIVPKYVNAEVKNFFANSHYLVVFIMLEESYQDHVGIVFDSKKIGEALRTVMDSLRVSGTSAEADVEDE